MPPESGRGRMGCGASSAAVVENCDAGSAEEQEKTERRSIEPLKKRKPMKKMMSRRRSNSVIRITDYTGEGKRGNRQRTSVVEANAEAQSPLGALGEGKVSLSGTKFHQHAVAGSAW